LILEYIAEDGSKQCKSYLLSDLSQAVRDMRLDVHDWLVSALAEISEEQLHSCFGAAEVVFVLKNRATSRGIFRLFRLWQAK
jgi:hypothetical protein